MNKSIWKLATIFLLALSIMFFGPAAVSAAKGGGGKPNPEAAGNNLSFPVIWAESVTKTLPGAAGMDPLLGGEWWYQWGTNGVDPDVTPASCPPDPDEGDPVLNPEGFPLCDDESAGTVDLGNIAGQPPADNPLPLARAYLQKDQYNTWQAWSGTPEEAGVAQTAPDFVGELWVDWIDWGDNLESVDWYTRSQVRTEVVLFQDNPTPLVPWLEYEMRHTSGWGINEVHGLAADLDDTPMTGPGDQATVYSPCARLTIQKLYTDRDDPLLAVLVWGGPEIGWTEPEGSTVNLIRPPIFDMAVHEAQDGPGYYNAEINVKGRIIYGYTWSVRNLNDDFDGTAAGDYRVTFSFDGSLEGTSCGNFVLNTFFVEGTTDIIVPEEEDLAAAAAAEGDDGESPEGGAVGVLVTENNLTYMDVRIHERSGGGGGGGKKR